MNKEILSRLDIEWEQTGPDLAIAKVSLKAQSHSFQFQFHPSKVSKKEIEAQIETRVMMLDRLTAANPGRKPKSRYVPKDKANVVMF